MKKALTLLGILAVVGVANATVRVFMTSSADPYGLLDNANHGVATTSTVDAGGSDSNTWDYYSPGGGNGPLVVGTFPPTGYVQPNPLMIPQGGFAYIWLQFQNEPTATINGLAIELRDPSTGLPANWLATTYYLANNKLTLNSKRWDGTATPPNYPEWHNNPQTFVSVTAYGIANTFGVNESQMWGGNLHGRIALLGAVEAAPLPPEQGGGYPAWGVGFEIHITNLNYSDTTLPLPDYSGVGNFFFVPEPTSLLLIGLAGLLIRRR
jgi:hypothetical protein